MTDFQLTTNQRDASDRHDLHEVIYLLSGLIPGRRTVPDQTFYWATREVTAPLGAGGADVTFEPMMSQPTQVLRAFGFEPGSQASTPAVPIPIRNLPFGHAESIVAAFSDDDYSFEDATATLRVAYVRPGQTVNDLVAADFRPLVLNGFFGPPGDVKTDGFVLPLHPKNAKRNQKLLLPELPGSEDFAGIPMDLADVGKMAPIIIGRPDGWFKPPTYQVNYRGFVSSGHAAGETQVVFELRSTSGGISDLWTASGAYPQKLFVHYRKPLYEIVTGSYNPERREVTVTLASGLVASVPRGGYVEHRRYKSDGSVEGNAWLVAAHDYGSDPTLLQGGWLFADGSIRPAPRDPWLSQFESRSIANVTNRGGKVIGHGAFSDSVIEFRVAEIQPGADSDPIPAVFFDPGAVSTVQQQPEFSSTTTAELDAYPVSHTGTASNGANAYDGNAETAASFTTGQDLYLSFNSAPSPFENDDVVAAVLHVIANGTLAFKNNAGSKTYGSIAGASVLQEYRFTVASVDVPNYNAILRVDASGTGGALAEAWWTYQLVGSDAATRTADVVVGETSGTVGEKLEFAEYVMRFPVDANRGAGYWFVDHTGANYFVDTTDLRWAGTTDVVGGGIQVPNVTPVGAMASLHAILGVEGDIENIDTASYDAAHLRFLTENIRVNAYIAERPSSWFELERQLGEEFRCFFYYGPSGHQCHFIETPETLEASGITVRQTFRLPGVPGANTFETGGAIMTRTPVSELTNTVEATWARDYIENDHLRRTEVANADSVSRLGVRRYAEGVRAFDLHTTNAGAVSGGVWDPAAQVSGILQVYADRQAYARTRFTFDTGWIAHGIDRGSLIRITYPVATTPPSYRNVVCEVESIQVSPINAERFQLTARSLYKPTKGIDLATIWTDVFTDSADFWTTRIKNPFDTWEDYWGLPDS